MAYIGQSPADKGTGLFSQDTFTGDGSTTTFDLTHTAPDGGGNDIQVFVDNVRQQEGTTLAYTLGQDGSGDNKRITFTTAPAASASIFVLNPGTKNVQQLSTISDNTVTTAKVQNSAITTAKINADAIDATKIADDAISEEHLDTTAIIGQPELSAVADSGDILLVYDTSAGALKKILASNINSAPTITSVSPTNAVSGDGTGNFTFVITGTNYNASATALLLNNSGTEVTFDSVTRNSATQITGVIAKSSLPGSGEPYDVVVLNPNGQQAKLRNQINVDQTPVYITASGSLGDAIVGQAGSFSVNATDPESAGNVTFELQSGSLPPSYTITNTAAEGGTAIIAGTDSSTSSTTTFNFVLRAVDAASNTSSRAFSIRSRVPVSQSFTSSGTFSVPAGITALDVLIVGGGGGGGNAPDSDSGDSGGGGGGAGGGLVFMPSYPVSPGGTVTVTVGAGSAAVSPETGRSQGADGADSAFGSPGDPGLGQGGILTAKGGGGGGAASNADSGRAGGSGGGAGGGQGGTNAAGPANQPTQPGNSGAYGFGNNGAVGNTNVNGGGGGGGGAGAVGATGMFVGGAGGAGKAYTISDGTTSVYYAGGGGATGGAAGPSGQGAGGAGGQGGGGTGSTFISPYPGQGGQAGQANTGGGGGAGGRGSCSTSAGFSKRGGKGIVIVRY